ncbi:MAG: adenylyltransferase/cytidyltransferase family protein, partial [Candidatus Omnitrophota bacterium]
MTTYKIKSLAEIKKIVHILRKKGKKIVFTNGCFDILHYGHLKYLEKAKKLGDILIVGVNT